MHALRFHIKGLCTWGSRHYKRHKGVKPRWPKETGPVKTRTTTDPLSQSNESTQLRARCSASLRRLLGVIGYDNAQEPHWPWFESGQPPHPTTWVVSPPGPTASPHAHIPPRLKIVPQNWVTYILVGWCVRAARTAITTHLNGLCRI